MSIYKGTIKVSGGVGGGSLYWGTKGYLQPESES